MLIIGLSFLLFIITFLEKSLFTKSKQEMDRIAKEITRLHYFVLFFKVTAHCALIIQTSYFLYHLLFDTNYMLISNDLNNNLWWTIVGSVLLVLLDPIIAIIGATIYNKIESSF